MYQLYCSKVISIGASGQYEEEMLQNRATVDLLLSSSNPSKTPSTKESFVIKTRVNTLEDKAKSTEVNIQTLRETVVQQNKALESLVTRLDHLEKLSKTRDSDISKELQSLVITERSDKTRIETLELGQEKHQEHSSKY